MSQQDIESTVSITTPRVMLVGAGRNIGTSTITLGVLIALKKAGLNVSTCKVGPSLAAATQYRRIAGRLCHQLDPWLLSKNDLIECFARGIGGADIGIIEGQYGLYDLRETDNSFLTEAAVAQALGAPIILVFNARGIREGAAAIVKGFMDFLPGLQIGGVIASWVESVEDNERIKRAVEALEGPLYLGGVPSSDPALLECDLEEAERDQNPSQVSRKRLLASGALAQASIDFSKLRAVAAKAKPISVARDAVRGVSRMCRIAVADDAAFHLAFQDNLDLIRRSGGELVAFSPLADVKLPGKINAIYFPGCYLHQYAEDCRANKTILEQIREFSQAGGVIFAEGSSLAFLGRKVILSNGKTLEMAGVIPATSTSVMSEDVDSVMEYCEVQTIAESVLADSGGWGLRGLRESRWAIRLEERIPNLFKLRKRDSAIEPSIQNVSEGISYRSKIAGTSVVTHWGSNPHVARHFLQAAYNAPLDNAKPSDTPS